MPDVCCEIFDRQRAHVGEKGLSVVAYTSWDARHFYLRAQPFEREVVEKYGPDPTRAQVASWPTLTNPRGGLEPYVITMDFPLKFCPNCGTNLEDWIEKNPKTFDALAAATSAEV